MGMNDTISAAIRKEAPAVGLDDTLRTAIQRLTETDSDGLMVSVDGHVAGVITTFDLMRSIVNNADLDQTRVSQFMTACQLIDRRATKTPCVQVDENESVRMALAVMDEAGVHNMLVSGSTGQAMGLVSARDLLRLAISADEFEYQSGNAPA
jgi:CBS domain-containing protein